MAKKSLHKQHDAAERALRMILLKPDQKKVVLANWAKSAFGQDAARALDQLKPAQTQRLLSLVLQAAHGVTDSVVAADHALRLALCQKGDPLVAAMKAAVKP
jgi:hypothetical protein